jgi:hypothetical protein
MAQGHEAKEYSNYEVKLCVDYTNLRSYHGRLQTTYRRGCFMVQKFIYNKIFVVYNFIIQKLSWVSDGNVFVDS